MADVTSITVVSGLPRSGTSLMMQMIDAGGIPAFTDRERAADDDNPRGYYELEAVKRTKADASWAADARGRVVKLVHVLLYDLPAEFEYRVVLMRRDLDEVLRSQKVMLERRGMEGARLSDDQLKSAFGAQLEKVAAWLTEQAHCSHLEVDYNRLMADPAAAAETVADFLGGTLDRAAMAAAVDPSLYRQRSS